MILVECVRAHPATAEREFLCKAAVWFARRWAGEPLSACGCRKPVRLMRPGHTRGSGRRVDRAVRSVRWRLEPAAGHPPSGGTWGQASGAADAGCRARRRLPPPLPDAVDPRSASGPAAHDAPCPPTAPRGRSRAAPHGRPHDPDALGSEDGIEGSGKFDVPVANQELEPLDAAFKVHEQVPGLLGHPRPGRIGGHAEDVYPAGGKLQHEQHVQALQQHRVDVEEVAGQDPLGLRTGTAARSAPHDAAPDRCLRA